MKYFSIVNWDQYQQYKDRDPKWIKLWRNLLDDYEFTSLNDSERSHLISIWLLAAKMSNKIPYDPKWVRSHISATSNVDLEKLVQYNFICVQDCTDSYSSVPRVREDKEEYKEEKNKRREEKNQDKDPNFLKFYEFYPVKKSKQEAAKSYARVIQDKVPHFEIMDGVERLNKAIEDGVQELKYVKHPSTWLNQGCWNDEYNNKKEDPYFQTEEEYDRVMAERERILEGK